MTNTAEKTYYAIEERQEGKWVVVAMTTIREKSFKIRNGIKNDHKCGWHRHARVVKAKPEIVRAYFFFGNKLWD